MKTVNNNLRLLALLFSVLITIVIMIGCEPYPGIIFDNQRNQEVKIIAAHVRDDGSIDRFVEQGTAPARTAKTIHITFLGPDWVNRIQAKDIYGEVVFSHDYTMPDLDKIGWKITIPP